MAGELGGKRAALRDACDRRGAYAKLKKARAIKQTKIAILRDPDRAKPARRHRLLPLD
jgi:hypothetical protein